MLLRMKILGLKPVNFDTTVFAATTFLAAATVECKEIKT